jgi:hypothetical protein
MGEAGRWIMKKRTVEELMRLIEAREEQLKKAVLFLTSIEGLMTTMEGRQVEIKRLLVDEWPE